MDAQEEVLKNVYDNACELLSIHASKEDFYHLFEESKAKITRPSLLKMLENYENAFMNLQNFQISNISILGLSVIQISLFLFNMLY